MSTVRRTSIREYVQKLETDYYSVLGDEIALELLLGAEFALAHIDIDIIEHLKDTRIRIQHIKSFIEE